MKLTAKASLQIQKPVDEVFDAVANSEHLTKYFISRSSGPMETGKKLTWEFGDFPGEFPVKIRDVKTNQSVSFVWDEETVVNIGFEAQPDNSTVVKITEGEKELNEQNLKWLTDNTFGWGNFLDCLKAYLEYGINLRKGAFDYMKQKSMMNPDIQAYNNRQSAADKEICDLLAQGIWKNLPEAESKIWHAHPVWFLDGNPTVGYSRQKPGVRLMFWSGADFEEEQLNVRGDKFKDASVFYSSVLEVEANDLKRWLEKSRKIQWDYKNLIKRKGVLEKMK